MMQWGLYQATIDVNLVIRGNFGQYSTSWINPC